VNRDPAVEVPSDAQDGTFRGAWTLVLDRWSWHGRLELDRFIHSAIAAGHSVLCVPDGARGGEGVAAIAETATEAQASADPPSLRARQPS